MKTESNIANGTVPQKLNLPPGAFIDKLVPIVGVNKVGWSSEDHIRLVEELLGCLKDASGKPPVLNTAQENCLKLVFRPTEDLQRSVLRQTFTEAGYSLSQEAEAVLVMLFSAAQFADFLVKNDNPSTGKPFIGKPEKRGLKKKTFASLISGATSPATVPAVADPAAPVVADEKTVDPKREPVAVAKEEEPAK